MITLARGFVFTASLMVYLYATERRNAHPSRQKLWVRISRTKPLLAALCCTIQYTILAHLSKWEKRHNTRLVQTGQVVFLYLLIGATDGKEN